MTTPSQAVTFTPGPSGTVYSCDTCGATVTAGKGAELLDRHAAWHKDLDRRIEDAYYAGEPTFGG